MAWRWLRTAHLAAMLAAMLAVPAAIDPADASSRLCRDLEARLASLGRTRSVASPQARRYEKAIRDQKSQIAKAERQKRRAGCSGSLFGRSSGNACQSIENTLDRMHSNLASLERKHAQLGGGRSGGDGGEKARLLASIRANDCRASAVAARDEPNSRNLFDELFGRREEQQRQEEEAKRRFPLSEDNRRRVVINRRGPIEILPNVTGSFRTLCVRTCDGYFFPVSFSTSARDLDRDEAACKAMCPGTEVELYLHRVPEEESEQMVSLAGVPYTELPSAFLYRDPNFSRPQNCGCNAERGFSIIAGETGRPDEGAPETVEPILPVPVARPDPASDPETLANRAGGLDREMVETLLAPPLRADETPVAADEGAEEDDGDRKVRVVGPVFLPDPEGAIDLTAPARTQAQ
ncbi:DUF2865 domain-containing protein [Nitratireductor mangrovi]|uniref:DUF2865 domain-containing protein n=1 Tax=Nitratireductor mangrovi TaxID=2599600 RepID=A0A5B8L2D0_9HYPH|nr:DUF2865 domain-containing protein [Nitratireductor mangrovi]QDZ01939.2 DUF2865 domain-containing protein [Nitratireductor mangrovi]